MSPSREYLERCAAASGYQVSPLEKVVRLGEFAANVSREPLLADTLALKGGTALNLCFGPPKRLSVDLDFNYIGDPNREKMLENRPRLEGAIVELASRMGYRIQRSAGAFAGHTFFLHYQSVLGQPDRIEVDINYLFRLPIFRVEGREIWQPGDLDRPVVQMVSLGEILIGKLLAFFSRAAPRDVWDLARLAQPAITALRTPHFRPWFIGLSATLDHLLPTYDRERLERMVTDRAVEEQLLPMLLAGQRVVRAELLEEAWAVARPFLDLGTGEAAYLESIAKGRIEAESLFPGRPDEARRLAEHPAILWKVTNVRGYLDERGKRSKQDRPR